MGSKNVASVLWFDQLRIGDRATVGGKGASLGELVQAGASVPPGFVITTAAFESFLRVFDADGRIRKQIRELAEADADVVRDNCKSIREELERVELPDWLRAEIAEAYQKICGAEQSRPVAVRSSGSSEDHQEASFAGLQDTFLWIKGVDDVVAAIKRCWSSLYSVESVTYRMRLKLPEEHVAMAVVIQDMVDAICAGVMFTRSPTTGDKSVIVLEAAWGLGSAVVSGEVTPDKFVINKITGEVTQRNISPKTIEHVPDMSVGRVVERHVPVDRQTAPCVSDEDLRALATIGKGIEKHYGQAMDIEWAIDRRAANSILLLQARPETVWSNRDKDAVPVTDTVTNPLAHVLRALSNRG